jgi:hypothetical protein
MHQAFDVRLPHADIEIKVMAPIAQGSVGRLAGLVCCGWKGETKRAEGADHGACNAM